MNKKFILIIAIPVSILAIATFAYQQLLRQQSAKPATGTSESLAYDAHTPSSLTVIVNKQNQLNPPSYVPEGLAPPDVTLRLAESAQEMQLAPSASRALEALFAAAKTEGVHLMLASGYRSYAAQEKLYNYYVSRQGQAEADRESARAGYSEHQTGLAADIAPATGKCSIEQCFADEPEGKWIAARAHEFGFVIRYPEGKEVVTGYTYEPWHLRFIGKEVALKVHDSPGKTLEEFFGLPAAPAYD